MKKVYTICFMVTGGVTIEAESEDEALSLFDTSPAVIADAYASLADNELTITDIIEEE